MQRARGAPRFPQPFGDSPTPQKPQPIGICLSVAPDITHQRGGPQTPVIPPKTPVLRPGRIGAVPPASCLARINGEGSGAGPHLPKTHSCAQAAGPLEAGCGMAARWRSPARSHSNGAGRCRGAGQPSHAPGRPLPSASPGTMRALRPIQAFQPRGPPPLKSRDLTPNAEALEARPLLEELGSKREGGWNGCRGGDRRTAVAGMWGRTHVAAPVGSEHPTA